MAITPNVSGEQAVKLAIRSQIIGGANTWWSNPDYATAVDALDTNYGVKLFDFVGISGGTYVISGVNGTISSITGTLTSTGTVGNLINALTAAAAVGTTYITYKKPSDFLFRTTTPIYVVAATGTAPSLVLGSGTGVASITQITGALTTMSAAYPSYYDTPKAAPTWVDDATAHFYQLDGSGAIVVNSGLVVQKQVRQIKTDPAETMILDGYFVAYSGNLLQTEQKNTKQQQC